MLWSYAIGQAVNGNLGDKFGGRRMVSCGAWLSFGMNWIVSFGSSFTSLLLPWSANGLFQSMGWAPGSRVLSNWSGHGQRGRVYGLYVFAAGLSSIIAFVTSTAILSLNLNWRWIFRIPVILLLVGGFAYYFIARDRPEDLGYDSPNRDDGMRALDIPEQVESSKVRYLAVLSNWRFLVACCAIGFQSVARYGLLVWVPVHFLGGDWKSAPAGRWITTALPIGMAAGALCSGWISDRYFRDRRSWGIAIFMGLAGVAAAGMFPLSGKPGVGVFLLFLCGFLVYGPQSAFWALCPDLLGHRRAGTGTGVMDMFAYLFAGLGEPLSGWLIQSHHNATGLIFPLVAVSCFARCVHFHFHRTINQPIFASLLRRTHIMTPAISSENAALVTNSTIKYCEKRVDRLGALLDNLGARRAFLVIDKPAFFRLRRRSPDCQEPPEPHGRVTSRLLRQVPKAMRLKQALPHSAMGNGMRLSQLAEAVRSMSPSSFSRAMFPGSQRAR